MSSIRVRKLDSTWDPSYGQGVDNYITDIEAVAQIVKSRLLLFYGEWWEDRQIGLPMWQSILGASGSKRVVVDHLIYEVIAGTPNVIGVTNLTSAIKEREYTFTATVTTDFGTIVVSNFQGV